MPLSLLLLSPVLLLLLVLLLLQGSLFVVVGVPAIEALLGGLAAAHCRSHLSQKRKKKKGRVQKRRQTTQNKSFFSETLRFWVMGTTTSHPPSP